MYANDRVHNECGANVPPSVDLENCSFERQGSVFQLCLKTVVTFLISYSFCSGVIVSYYKSSVSHVLPVESWSGAS